MKNAKSTKSPERPAAKPAAKTKPPAKAASASKPAAKPAAKAAKEKSQPADQPAPTAQRPTEPQFFEPEKHYKLTAEQLLPIAQGHGACIASDKITVDGAPVGFMYREEAIHGDDSGWRFFAGTESDAYMATPSNHAFYDCNTIANYDRSIVPYLESPIGSMFERPPGAAEFERVTDEGPED
jgi:hypothetical protein